MYYTGEAGLTFSSKSGIIPYDEKRGHFLKNKQIMLGEIILLLWLLSCCVALPLSKTFIEFIVACIGSAFWLFLIFIVLHFAIKYW
jgi:hypothetical protein